MTTRNWRMGSPRPGAAGRLDRAGFLLVEALATLAISAAVLVGLASILGLMLRVGDRAAARAQDVELDGRAVAALRRDIQHLARARWSGAARRSFVFVGGSDRIMFAQSTPGPGGFANSSVVIIQSVGTDAGGRLLRAEAALPPGAGGLDELRFGPARDFHEGRFWIRFAYFGRAGDGGEILVDDWPSRTELPSAVRIAIVEPATGVLMSALRVPILSDAEPGCAGPKLGFCSRAAEGADEAARNETGKEGGPSPTRSRGGPGAEPR